MRNSCRSRVGMFTLVLMSLSLTGTISGAGTMSARAQDLPEGKGKEIVADVCAQCHGLRQVVDSKLSPEDWKDTVGRMVSNGAPLADEDVQVVIDYLAKNFPPEKSADEKAGGDERASGEKAGGDAKASGSAKADDQININKAEAKEMVASLHLTDDEAASVVKYREEHGEFHGWDDLQKVAGLDIKKLEPMKDRLTY
jgi:competence ComEA-like helix-hairpin-helix protein